jgi:FkbM family methyltransferase
MTTTIETLINGRWRLKLLHHRAKLDLWRTGWEVERVESMHANLKPGMKIWDIGAEEGDFACLWSSWGCEVGLIEPGERVWANICETWRTNNAHDPLFCYQGFAGAKNYVPSGYPHEQRHLWPMAACGPIIDDHGFRVIHERPDIPSRTLDSLAEQYGEPDALTIDVEGAEFEVFKGAERVLREVKPLIWVSLHPEPMANAFDTPPSVLQQSLRDMGYGQRLLWLDHELHLFAWHPDVHDPVLP